MAINVSQAFHRTSANPVDETMALTKAQMLTVNDNLMPAYYLTICQDDGFIYLYDKTATPNGTTGKFTQFSGGGDSIQVSSLPTASVSEVDKIYQYIGATDATYKNGYFYKCINNSGTYIQSQLNVQPSSGGGGGGHTIVNTAGTSMAQEDKLQFIGAEVTDDSTNGITKVAGAGLNSDSLDDIVAGASTPTNVRIGDAYNYSTTEKIIGQWIDGKPLYQKTIIGNTGSEGISNIDVASLNINKCIDIEGFVLQPNGNTYNCAPFTYISENANQTAAAYYSKNIEAIGVRCKGYNSMDCQITIRYTKTTD